MSELAKGKWWLRAAAVTVAATVSLGPTSQLSHATESGQTVASTSVVAHDFDGGDVSWSEIAKETGFPEAKITGDPVLFSLAKVAEQRKLGLKNLWDEFRKQPTGATLADLGRPVVDRGERSVDGHVRRTRHRVGGVGDPRRDRSGRELSELAEHERRHACDVR